MSVDLKVIKLKIRRGTDSQRQNVILDQGELGYTTDTKRVFVGDGTTTGGVIVGAKVHNQIYSTGDVALTEAVIGDLVNINGQVFQLTATDFSDINSWALYGAAPDSRFLTYSNNLLTIKSGSLSGGLLNQSALSSPTIKFDSNKIVVNYNTSQFALCGTPETLSLKQAGISGIHIAPQALSGLTISNNKLIVNVDNDTLGFNGSNKLTVLNTPVTAVRHENLRYGFNVEAGTNKIDTIVTGVDSSTFALCGTGIVTLKPGFSAQQELPYLKVEDGGVIHFGNISSIYDILSADDNNFKNFNGSPDQLSTSYNPSNGRDSEVAVISAGDTKTLQSAGFIVFQGGSPTRNDSTHIPDMFAIPVFTFKI